MQSRLIYIYFVVTGCDLNTTMHYGNTALYCAAQLGHTDIVQLLVQAGTSVDKPDSKGCTPLLGQSHISIKRLHVHALLLMFKIPILKATYNSYITIKWEKMVLLALEYVAIWRYLQNLFCTNHLYLLYRWRFNLNRDILCNFNEIQK